MRKRGVHCAFPMISVSRMLKCDISVTLNTTMKIVFSSMMRYPRQNQVDAAISLLSYHGVLCHQARDLFSAGSVANPDNDDNGGLYIERAVKLLENAMLAASAEMEDALFVEYWGESVKPEDRIRKWLEKADAVASGWKPSVSLFGGRYAK